MDEFELFRAQAYSGGVPSTILSSSSSPSPTAHHVHDKRRRHSSVATLGQDAVATATVASGDTSPAGQSRHQGGGRERRNRLLAAMTGQSLDLCGASYDVADAIVANVTVAIEPPSPTETRRQLNVVSSPSASPPAASGPAAAAGSRETDHIDDNDDDRYDDVVRSNAKRRPNKSPLRRRVTSPEAVLSSPPSPSPPQAEAISEIVLDESVTSRPTVDDWSQSLIIDGNNVNLQSHLLPLPGTNGSGQQTRRLSTCGTAGSLRPAASECASPRRNSCTALVQSSSSLPLTPPRPTSRRNSAVTYLPDAPQTRCSR